MNAQSGYEINEAARFGGFWIRVLAYFIDMVILVSVFLPVGIILLSLGLPEQLAGVSYLVVVWVYSSVLGSSS